MNRHDTAVAAMMGDGSSYQPRRRTRRREGLELGTGSGRLLRRQGGVCERLVMGQWGDVSGAGNLAQRGAIWRGGRTRSVDPS